MKAKVFLPPNKIQNRPSVFLAGSIEMGKAIDWQQQVTIDLMDHDIDIYNPRRTDWDSSWEQSIGNEQFYNQVCWELDALERATYILMFFDGATKSPISLLELGLHARSNKLIVVCPYEFWRKGNVDVLCEYYDIDQFDTLDEAVQYIKDLI